MKITYNSVVLKIAVFQFLLIYSFASSNVIVYVITFLYPLTFLKNRPPDFYMTRSELKFFLVFLVYIIIFSALKIEQDPLLIAKGALCSFGFLFSCFLSKNLKNMYYGSLTSILFFQLFIIGGIMYFGFNNFPMVSPLEKIFQGKSGNGITSYLIILQIHLFICHLFFQPKRNYLFYVTFFFTFLISASTYGRGSLISSIFLIFVLIVFYKRNFKLLLAIPISFFLIAVSLKIDVVEFVERYTKLGRGLNDYYREAAIFQYLDKINVKSFLIGANYKNTIISKELNNNPHNSFIRGHHNFGFIYLFTIGMSVFLSIINHKRFFHRGILSVLFLILFFRIFTEPVLFPTIFDYFFFSSILLIKRNENKRIQNL